jgi:hypothetical protein
LGERGCRRKVRIVRLGLVSVDGRRRKKRQVIDTKGKIVRLRQC